MVREAPGDPAGRVPGPAVPGLERELVRPGFDRERLSGALLGQVSARRGTEPFKLFRSEFGQNSWNP